MSSKYSNSCQFTLFNRMANSTEECHPFHFVHPFTCMVASITGSSKNDLCFSRLTKLEHLRRKSKLNNKFVTTNESVQGQASLFLLYCEYNGGLLNTLKKTQKSFSQLPRSTSTFLNLPRPVPGPVLVNPTLLKLIPILDEEYYDTGTQISRF